MCSSKVTYLLVRQGHISLLYLYYTREVTRLLKGWAFDWQCHRWQRLLHHPVRCLRRDPAGRGVSSCIMLSCASRCSLCRAEKHAQGRSQGSVEPSRAPKESSLLTLFLLFAAHREAGEDGLPAEERGVRHGGGPDPSGSAHGDWHAPGDSQGLA